MKDYQDYQVAADSMLPELLGFVQALAAGMAVAALVFAVFAWPWRKPGRRLGLGGPLAVGLAFLLAAYVLTGRPRSWLGEDQDRLLALVLPVAMLVEMFAAFIRLSPSPLGEKVEGESVASGPTSLPRRKRGRNLFLAAWLLRALLACAIGRILLHGTSYLDEWSAATAWLWFGGLAALLLAGWYPLVLIGRQAARPTVLLSLALSAALAGATILNEGYLTGGKLAMVLAAILFTLAALAFVLRDSQPADGLIGVSVVIFFYLLLMGRFFGTLSDRSIVILFLSPLLCGLFELPWLRIQSNTMRGAVGVLAAGLPPLVVAAPYFLDYNTRTVLLAVSLLGASSGIVGCFAVLRKRSLAGDALAHAALPGICIAYLIVRERDTIALLLGALGSGLVGIAVISLLRRWTRIKEDAAIGLVLGVFFGGGIFLLSIIQHMPRGGAAGLASFILGKTASIIQEDVDLIAVLAGATVLVVLLLYKEFKLVSFDADFAQTQGWPALPLDLLLMALVAVTVVVGLPAVGVVMMAALLIIPAATARFWTERLMVMLFLAALTGVLMGAAGALLSNTVGIPAGPAIILVGAGLFVLSALFAPRRGLLARTFEQARFERELRRRDILRVLFELTEPRLPARPALKFEQLLARKAWTPAQLRNLLAAAQGNGWVDILPDGFRLTDNGLHRAAQVMRGQRLWELFLREYPDLAQSYANLGAESVEEVLPEPLVRELEAKLPLTKEERA